MNDRELLEMAAKAVGYPPLSAEAGMVTAFMYDRRWVFWNPLVCDGDSLRLASELNLCIHINGPYVSADNGGSVSCTEEIFTMDSRMTGIRKAIVRVAAEIGKAMP